jgi:hypothetical protein
MSLHLAIVVDGVDNDFIGAERFSLPHNHDLKSAKKSR